MMMIIMIIIKITMMMEAEMIMIKAYKMPYQTNSK